MSSKHFLLLSWVRFPHRLPSSWEEGQGVEETNTVITFFRENTNKSLEEMKETKAEQETQQLFRDGQTDYQPLTAYL